MNAGLASWKTIEHTADLAIEVMAPTLETLFAASAMGLSGLLQGTESGTLPTASPQDGIRQDFDLRETDLEGLLVEWLRELLFLASTRQLLFSGVTFETLTEFRLKAHGYFCRAAAGSVQRELKGVTYHDLEVGRRSHGWIARIVFDV